MADLLKMVECMNQMTAQIYKLQRQVAEQQLKLNLISIYAKHDQKIQEILED
jgi:hypothetical protein